MRPPRASNHIPGSQVGYALPYPRCAHDRWAPGPMCNIITEVIPFDDNQTTPARGNFGMWPLKEAGPRVESRRPSKRLSGAVRLMSRRSSKDLTDTRRSSVDLPETSAAAEGTAQGESVVGAVDAAVLQATLQGIAAGRANP